jgi:hypothetical protein
VENLDEIIKSLGLENKITLSDIPGIDLYMDQVIQLFEHTYSQTTRNKEEKVLTKTMINNYAKGKLFFPIKNKRYSKNHLILISLIYQLKGGLSINDIKATLEGINQKTFQENFNLESFYESFLNVLDQNVDCFNEEVVLRENAVKKEIEKVSTDDSEYLRKVLLIASLVNMSNFYRRVAEKLVDEISELNSDEKAKD